MQLRGELLKYHYPILKLMYRSEHTASLFFNDVSKLPTVPKIITAQKLFNIFGSGICSKPH